MELCRGIRLVLALAWVSRPWLGLACPVVKLKLLCTVKKKAYPAFTDIARKLYCVKVTWRVIAMASYTLRDVQPSLIPSISLSKLLSFSFSWAHGWSRMTPKFAIEDMSIILTFEIRQDGCRSLVRTLLPAGCGLSLSTWHNLSGSTYLVVGNSLSLTLDD